MLVNIKNLWKIWQYGDSFMILAALAALSINISVGFCQGFSAILLPQLKDEDSNLTDEQSSWIASLGVISNPIGALIGGMLVDAIGRKLLLQSIIVPNLIGWLVIAVSESYVYLCAGRFITGFTIGMSTVSYVYVAEVTTPEKRGVLCAVGPGLVSLGIFFIYVLGAYVHWKQIAAICAGVSLLTPCLLHFVPESPLWLASKGEMDQAYNSLLWLRQNNNTAQQELMEFNSDRGDNQYKTFRQKLGLFKKISVLRPFIILIMFFMFQELSGIYVILYYAVDFFKSVGTNINEFTASIIVGGVRVIMGVVGACLINSFKRKTLAAISGLMLGLAMLGAALCDSFGGDPVIKLACILLHVSSSMVGFLQLPWIMSGELYPQDIRGIMSGATACCAYILIFVNVKTYPHLENILTSTGTLYLFGVCALLGAVYCLIFLPETKGKTLSEIMKQFDDCKKGPNDTEKGTKVQDAIATVVQRKNSGISSISLDKKGVITIMAK